MPEKRYESRDGLEPKVGSVYDRISKAVRHMEVVLAAFLVVIIMVSFLGILISLINLGDVQRLIEYVGFQELLSHVLLLIIGLELTIMLIRHDLKIVIEVTIFAIARKMLIYNTTASEMLISILGLAILFIVKIYVIDHGIFLRRRSSEQVKD